MRVAVSADHAGFPLKATVITELQRLGHQIVDAGGDGTNPLDDYPDYSKAVAQAVASGAAERGVIVCGSGVGASVAANKVRGIRCALCHDSFSARQGVEDDNMNVLALGARVIGPALTSDLVRIFMQATFSGQERHARRLGKITKMEEEFCEQ